MTEPCSDTAADTPTDVAATMPPSKAPGARLSGNSYRVEEADLNAAGPQIARLWLGNLEGYTAETAARKLRAGYLRNPAGHGLGLLLATGADPDPAGVQCLHPRRLHVDGKVLNAASIADFAVAREHRSLGPALMLIRAIAALGRERFDLVYGLPNESAAAVCRRGGLRQIGSSQRYVKVLRWQHLLARHMSAGAATLLSTLAEPLRRLYEGVRRLGTRPLLRGRSAAWSDPAIDDIWARRSTELLLSERTASMLAWRFADAPGASWRLCIASDSGGVPQGYVVWRLIDGIAEIGDLSAADPAHHLAPVLLCFFGIAAAEGAVTVSMEFTAAPQLLAGLKKAGMVPRGSAGPVFTVPPADGEEAVADADRWYLTRFDNDSD